MDQAWEQGQGSSFHEEAWKTVLQKTGQMLYLLHICWDWEMMELVPSSPQSKVDTEQVPPHKPLLHQALEPHIWHTHSCLPHSSATCKRGLGKPSEEPSHHLLLLVWVQHVVLPCSLHDLPLLPQDLPYHHHDLPLLPQDLP